VTVKRLLWWTLVVGTIGVVGWYPIHRVQQQDRAIAAIRLQVAGLAAKLATCPAECDR